MPLITKSYHGTPTFKGLRVRGFEGKGTTSLVPWDRLEARLRGSWYVRDQDGNRVKHGRRTVSIWMDAGRRMRLGYRLHSRHLRTAWKSGQLGLTIVCRKHYLSQWFVWLLCLTCGTGFAYLLASRMSALWNPDPSFLQLKHLVAMRILVAAFCLGSMMLIGAGIWFLPWKRQRSNARTVLIDRQGIHAHSFDGRDRLVPWETVCEIKRTMNVIRIEVAGQEPVIIPHECPRPVAWNHFFSISLPSKIHEQEECRERGVVRRLRIWLIVGGCLYLPAVWLIPPHPTLTPVQAGVVATALYAATCVLLVGLANAETIGRKLRRMWRACRRLATSIATLKHT